MDFMDIVRTRRSVRRYDSRPVEQLKIDALFEAVRRSPSWSNKQCPRFVLVRDEADRKRISELSYVEALMAPMGYKANPSQKALAEAPVVVVACADPAESGQVRGQDYYLVDTGIAAQTMMLAANALGLATVFVGIYDEDEIRGLLNIPENVRVVGLFPLGYPLDEVKKDGPPRKPLSETLFEGRWGGHDSALE